jgi:hypothetical protein
MIYLANIHPILPSYTTSPFRLEVVSVQFNKHLLGTYCMYQAVGDTEETGVQINDLY